MALRVGSIFSEYTLETEGVRAGVTNAVLHLTELRGAYKTTRIALERENERILGSFKKLTDELRGLNPFQPLIESGAKAYKSLIGSSIIPDLHTQTLKELTKMRAGIDAINAFDPLVVDAARSAAGALDEVEKLKSKLEKEKIRFGQIGVSPEDLRTVTDEAGKVRDEVLKKLRPGQSATLRPTDPGFGMQRDREAQLARMNEILRKSQSGTDIGSLKGDLGSFGHELADLLQEASDTEGEIHRLEAAIRSLEETAARGGANELGQALLEADEAADAADQGLRALTDAEKRLGGNTQEIDEYTASIHKLAAEAMDDATAEERRIAVMQEAEEQQQVLTSLNRVRIRLEEEVERRTENQTLAVARLSDANRKLQDILEQVNRAKRGAVDEASGGAPTTSPIIEKERLRQQQQAERDAELERKRAHETAQLKLKFEMEAQQAAADQLYKLEQQRLHDERQNIIELKRLQIEADAEVQKVRLTEEAKLARQRERLATQGAKALRVVRGGAGTITGLSEEESSAVRRARSAEQYGDALTVVEQRLKDQTLTLSQINRLESIRSDVLKEQERTRRAQDREAQRIMDLLQPAAATGPARDRRGLTEDENAIIDRARATAQWAEALSVVDTRLQDTTLALSQINRLEATRADILQEQVRWQQAQDREQARIMQLLLPQTKARTGATGLNDDERSIINRAKAEGKYSDAIQVVDDRLADVSATLSQQNNLLALRRKLIEQGLRFQAESERRADAAAERANKRLQPKRDQYGLDEVDASVIRRARAEDEFSHALAIVDENLKRAGLSLAEYNNLLTLRRNITDQQTASEKKLNREMEGEPSILRTIGGSFTNLAGALGLATFGYEAITRSIRGVKESFNLDAEIDEQRRTLGQLIGSQDRANRALETGISFGQKYGFTVSEMAEAARTLAPQMRTSNVELEKQFEILARLAARQPSQGIAGAAFAIGELSAGDIQSLADRFNIPRRIANQMKAEVLSGADPFSVLDKTLTRLGLTAEVLGERMQGGAGGIREVKVATEELKIALGDVLEGPGTSFLKWLADVERQTADTIDGLRGLGKAVPDNAPLVPENALQGINRQSGVAADAGKGLNQQLTLILRPLEMIPFLLRALGGQGQENLDRIAAAAGETGHEIEMMSDQISVATNRFTEGRTTTAQYATELRRIAEINKVKPLKPDVSLDTIPELTRQLEEYQAKASKDTQFAVKELPRAVGLARELARLQAMSPIELTVEMRTQQVQDAAAAVSAIVDRIQQTNTQLGELDQGEQERQDARFRNDSQQWTDHLNAIARIRSDFSKAQKRQQDDFDDQQDQQREQFRNSTQRADRDFNQQMARSLEDRNRAVEREARDFRRRQDREARDQRREDEEAEQEHLDRREEIRQQEAKRVVDIEKDMRKQLQKLQRDYDVEATRNLEDYQLERMTLLAEGRITEARVLESQFEKTRRRAAEDLARSRSDVGDEGATQRDEAQTDAEEQLAKEQSDYEKAKAERKRQRDQARQDAAEDRQQQLDDQKADFDRERQQALDARNQQKIDAQADFDAMIAQNKAAHDQQVQDAKDANAQQIQDMQDAYTLQRARADFENGLVEQQYRAHRQQIVDDLVAFLADEKAKHDQSYSDIKRLEELKATVVDENERKAIVAMENALKEMDKLVGKQVPLMYDSGVANGLAWIKGWIDGLKGGAGTAGGGAGVGDSNPLNDPTPPQAAITNLFGPNARVTSTYDSARKAGEGVDVPGDKDLHGGLDVTMFPGQRVPSPIEIHITRVFADQFGGGTTVMGVDKEGRQWLFAHLYRSPVKAGQVLRKGATLGYIGAEGHVHIQLRKADDMSTPIDPSAALASEAASNPYAPVGAGAGSSGGGGAAWPNGINAQSQSQRVNLLNRQGYNDGAAYRTGMIDGLQSKPLPDDTLTLRMRQLQDPSTYTAAGGASGLPPQPINITLHSDVVMDGQRVGTIVAPVVADQFNKDLNVSARVVESVYTPGVHQEAFRRS